MCGVTAAAPGRIRALRGAAPHGCFGWIAPSRPRPCGTQGELRPSQHRHVFCGVLNERPAIVPGPHDDKLVNPGR